MARTLSTDGTNRRTLAVVAAVALAVVVGTVAAGTVLSASDGQSSAFAGPTDVANQQEAPSGFSGVVNASEADAKLSGEARNDTAGWSVASAGDVDGDGVEDLLVGAPGNDTAAGNDSGAAYVFFGPIERDEVDLSEANVTLTGVASGDQAGWSVASAGDLDDDGVDDVIVGAPTNDDNGTDAGAAYVVHGGSWLSGTVSLAEANATLYGSEDDRAGWSVSNTTALPDNKSGVIVGASTADDGNHDAGAAYLVRADALDGNVSLEGEADAKLLGEGTGDHAGSSVSWAGDVNDDGVQDVVVGAPDNDSVGEDSGAAYVVYGPVEGTHDLSEANLTMRGESAFDNAGSAVSTAGDLNNDSVDDVIVGAPGNDTAAGNDSGAAYVVYGGDDLPAVLNLSDADLRLNGSGAGDRAGTAVAPAGSGDVTCDAVDDVLVGAPFNNSTAPNAGAAYLVAGGESLPDATNLSDSQATFVGENASDRFGYSVGSAGDQNGDGVDDVVIGAPYNDTAAGNDSGAAYLFHGDCPEPPKETETPTPTPSPSPTPKPEEPEGVAVTGDCVEEDGRITVENENEETEVRVEVTGSDGFETLTRLDPGERETLPGLVDGRYRVATFVDRERLDVTRITIDCDVVETPTETETPTATPTETETETMTPATTEPPTETTTTTTTAPPTTTTTAPPTTTTTAPPTTTTTEATTTTTTTTMQPQLPSPRFAGCSQIVLYSDGSVTEFDVVLYNETSDEYTVATVDIADADDMYQPEQPVFGSGEAGVIGYGFEQGDEFEDGLKVVGAVDYYGTDYVNPHFDVDTGNCGSAGPPTPGGEFDWSTVLPSLVAADDGPSTIGLPLPLVGLVAALGLVVSRNRDGS